VVGGQVRANDDVDIYDSPVEPRKVIGMMEDDTSAPSLEHHPDGWCKIDTLKLFDGTTGPGWVAEDHLKFGAAPKTNEVLQQALSVAKANASARTACPGTNVSSNA
jgi:hypothetical protein